MSMERQEKQQIMQRLTEIRATLLGKYPFFGRLLMQLKFGIANCETAYTDMTRIVFDPKFLARLSDEEVAFVMMHEVMHCVLQHCLRGHEKEQMLFNIACDIVVNSNIMQSMGVDEFVVDGEVAMHLAPDDTEGYLYDAETVYDMLIAQLKANGSDKNSDEDGGNTNADGQSSSKDSKMGKATQHKQANPNQNGINDENKVGRDDRNAGVGEYQQQFDRHDPWRKIEVMDATKDSWEGKVKNAIAAVGSGNSDLPPAILIAIDEAKISQKLQWKELLKQFISKQIEDYDYTFSAPERRGAEFDFILPGLYEIESDHYENLWFCVDTSGSMSDEMVNMIYAEIRNAVITLERLSGQISFFDHGITEPKAFRDIKTLNECRPIGRGGTDFSVIFHYLRDFMLEQLPKAIIILTDGYAPFPNESVALGVPVLWVIVDGRMVPPWGEYIRVES